MDETVEITLPAYALKALDVLERAGFEAWCVGGFVRDSLLGRPISDVDIATSALWRQTKEAFESAGFQAYETGTAHGTVTAVVDGVPMEITTYRTEGTYSDSRHPDSVSFVSNIEDDLARRDFTINAMAYHPARGLLDPYDGRADLAAGLIRCVGNPVKRFSEDALRVLRACRFSSQLGFKLDAETKEAAIKGKTLVLNISAERITHELEEFLLGHFVHDALMDDVDILSGVMPELVAMKGFDQRTRYHIYDVLEHTAYVIQQTPSYPLVRWAALFHDMGKPGAFFTENGVGHFYGHARVSMVLAEGIMNRLVFTPAMIRKVLTLVRIHDEIIESTPQSVKHALVRMDGDVDLFRALCDLKLADALSQAPDFQDRYILAKNLTETFSSVVESGQAFSIRQLAVNGNDVMSLGVTAGPRVGDLLRAALSAVIDDQVANERDALLQFLAGRL